MDVSVLDHLEAQATGLESDVATLTARRRALIAAVGVSEVMCLRLSAELKHEEARAAIAAASIATARVSILKLDCQAVVGVTLQHAMSPACK